MERVLLISRQGPKDKLRDITKSLDELARLVDTAGGREVGRVIQKSERINPAFFIGKGKAAELAEMVSSQSINALVFDEELRPVQQKNLEELTKTKIVDRTRLIIDIFSQRARTREGILQVERAQLTYFLTRLSKQGIMLDSQSGGIGARGPGERKLEMDQRIIRDRMSALDRQIEQIRSQRKVLRDHRLSTGQPLVAIVGYTNAGKSTLLNSLSGRNDIYADNKLFATLDPTTRRVILPGKRPVLFTDTVGFINKLPHSLIAAFRATLEEVNHATCLLHVIDISNPDHLAQSDMVTSLLNTLGAGSIPLVRAYNKSDLLPKARRKLIVKQGGILISAKSGEGIQELLKAVERIVLPKAFSHKVTITFDKNRLIDKIYEWSVVKKRNYTSKGVKLDIECTPEFWQKIKHILKTTG